MDTIEWEKTFARNSRQDLINALDTIISESQRLKDRLERAKKKDDFSSESNTNGSLYGVIALPVIGAVQLETAYNVHLQIVQSYTVSRGKDEADGNNS